MQIMYPDKGQVISCPLLSPVLLPLSLAAEQNLHKVILRCVNASQKFDAHPVICRVWALVCRKPSV